MKVLFVCNNAYNPGNGLSTSVKNTMAALRRHGVDARLMAVRNPDPGGPQPDFPLEHFKFPLLEPIIYANGILLPEEPVRAASVSPEAPVNILCIGRLAAEKSQETLLEAVRYSRYAGRLRLIFGGNGPKGKRYRKIAGRLHAQGVLKIAPVFGFYSHEQIAELVRGSYLYVHCAWVEVEGLSCLEAMREGIVPVIAEGELIGTSAFALCPESLYPVRDSRALAARIDWWIEHPRERDAMAQRYADAARNYGIDRSVEALIAMFRQSLSPSAR